LENLPDITQLVTKIVLKQSIWQAKQSLNIWKSKDDTSTLSDVEKSMIISNLHAMLPTLDILDLQKLELKEIVKKLTTKIMPELNEKSNISFHDHKSLLDSIETALISIEKTISI